MLFEFKSVFRGGESFGGLNPYSNGICSLSDPIIMDIYPNLDDGLNPYSNGICSLSTFS